MLIRKSNERGHANHGWLDSYHSFSFANYYDPNWMGFSVLRVINEDFVAPNKGFGTHGHRDMEIITYMVSGELTHKDSMGNVETLHLLQIWIEPSELDLEPSYEDQLFTDAQKYNQWCLLASDESHEGALKVNQNMELFAAKISERKQLDYSLMHKRCAYIHIVQGTVQVNQQQLNAGDAALFMDGELIQVKAVEAAELLLFDLPPA